MTAATALEPILVLPAGAPRGEWLAARKKGLGGSDITAILGLDQWTSPYSVWAEKTGRVIDDRESEPMLWGNLLEPVVREEFARRTGLTVDPTPGTLARPDALWQLCNPDGIVGTDALYEGKTANQFKASDWADGVPDRTTIQCQWECHVTGRRLVHVAALIGGQTLHIAEVRRDDELIEMLVAQAEDFWNLVVSGTAPRVDGHKATTDVLNRLWGASDDQVRVLDPVVCSKWLDARRQAKAEIKRLDALCAEAENHIKAELGDATVGLIHGEKAVTWNHTPACEVAAFTRKASRTFRPAKTWS